jgi:hypothetical protein
MCITNKQLFLHGGLIRLFGSDWKQDGLMSTIQYFKTVKQKPITHADCPQFTDIKNYTQNKTLCHSITGG